MDQSTFHPALRPRRRRLWPVFVAPGLMLVAAIAWTGMWFYAAARAERLIDGWREREARAGRIYECANRSVGGYPFRIEVRCSQASAALSSMQPPQTLRLGDLLVVAQVYDPTLLIAEFSAPMTIAEGAQSPSLSATWKLGQASLRGLPDIPQRASLVFDEAGIDRIDSAVAQPLLRAKHAELHGRLSGAVNDHPQVEIVSQLLGATMGALHPVLAQPFDSDITAKLSGLADFAPKPWSARFREIQAAGGGIDIVQSRLQQGDLIAVSTGRLGLTPAGRLNGELRMTVAGIERVIPALGLDKLLAQSAPPSQDRPAGGRPRDLGAMLGSLDKIVPGLGNLAREHAGTIAVAGLNALGQPTTLEGKKAIVLPLRFVDGAVFIGPLQVGQTPALF